MIYAPAPLLDSLIFAPVSDLDAKYALLRPGGRSGSPMTRRPPSLNRALSLALCALAFVTFGACRPEAAADAAPKLYQGNWFDISYPGDFTARPLSPVNPAGERRAVETDEAYFRAPDGGAEFYVYSPLWSGEPEYLQIRADERTLRDEGEESGPPDNLQRNRFIITEAADGAAGRMILSVRTQIGTGSDTHHVFGFEYRDRAAYELYTQAFEAFKASLQQYAD
jgi:hypothetical protein